MTFYLVSLVLIGALILATWRVARMHREIRTLRDHHGEFERSMADATLALAKVGRMIDGIYGEGGRMLLELGTRIEEGREILARLDDLAGRSAHGVDSRTESLSAGGGGTRFPNY